MEEELGETIQNKPSSKTLSCLLEKVLKLNNFTFGNEHYIQIKGTAMGTRVAPNFANVYMGRLEERFVYQTEAGKPYHNLGTLYTRILIKADKGNCFVVLDICD